MSGTSHTQLADLHKKYGDVVRVAPNQVSFVNPKAWKDAMGHRKAGQLENGRDPAFYKHTFPGIIGPIPAEDHGRQRRILSHAFSAQSMLDQQPLIQQYVDLLLTKLKANCNGGRQALDMVQWYNWTTFDVIGDLAFGEPFGCLTDSNYHPWVSLIFQGIKQTTLVTQLRRVYLGADELILRFVPSLMNKRSEHGGLSRAKVAKRMALGTERPDFMQAMLAKNADGKDVSPPPHPLMFPSKTHIIRANANGMPSTKRNCLKKKSKRTQTFSSLPVRRQQQQLCLAQHICSAPIPRSWPSSLTKCARHFLPRMRLTCSASKV